jgi:signal transduction histidine kinase
VSTSLIDALRTVPIFSDLSAEQLEWLASHGNDEVHDDGAMLFLPGSEADSMTAILEGSIDVLLSIGGQMVPFLTQRAGTVTGLLPYSRLRTYPGSGKAVGRTRIYRLYQAHFDEMLRMAPGLGPRLVALMTDRVRETTRLTQQREKMMALGKLAAGLAHEINNPAAAAGRAAASLQEHLRKLPQLTAQLHEGGVSDPGLPAAFALMIALAAEATPAGRPAAGSTMNGLERSAREDALTAWMERHAVEESWVLAETFVEAGIGVDALESLASTTRPEMLSSLVAWFEAIVAAQRLAADIHAATARVSELVGAVKVYSHMDRAGAREGVKLQHGIDSTLVMLGHKLKRGNITLERAFDPGLPDVDAYPGELNQVWTNLIDNAIDAMPDGGTLRIETARDGSVALVRIIDSGTGIPPEIQPRIFEAFFTTKPVGEGTGLGLDIVQRIVAQQHAGKIDVESRPGRTVFTVRLPIAG